MDWRGQSSASSGFCSGAARDLCVALRSGDPCRHKSFQFPVSACPAVYTVPHSRSEESHSPGGGGGVCSDDYPSELQRLAYGLHSR